MSNKRMKTSHANLREGEELSASFEDLQNENDIMNVIFSFIPGSYVTVAPVSKQFYSDYSTRGIHESAAFNSADSLLKIGRNRRTTADAVSNDVKLTEYCFINNAPENFMIKACQKAALKGRSDILECAHAFGIDFSRELIWNDGMYLKLVEQGNLEMLQYFDSSEHIEDFNDYTWGEFFEAAVETKQLHIMKWIFKEKFQSLPSSTYSEIDLSMQSAIEAHEYVFEGIIAPRKTFELCVMASQHGNIEVLEYCHRNNYRFETDELLCDLSMDNKDKKQALATLKWLRHHGCLWEESLCRAAASNDNFDALKWARSEGCPWDEETLEEAVDSENIAMIEYCLQNQCPMSKYLYFNATTFKDHDAALEVFKLLRKHSCPWDMEICGLAAIRGHFELALWAKTKGCPWTMDNFALIVARGNLSIIEEVLQEDQFHEESMFIKTGGKVKIVPAVARAIDGEIFHQAYDDNDNCIVEKLKLLLNYGYEWDDQTFAQAAKRGRLRVLKWLRYMGCPIYADTCVAAVEYGSMEILKYAYEVAGCALSKEAYAYCFSGEGLQHHRSIPTTVRDSRRELLKYLERNDCPKPDKSDWRIY